MLLNHFLEKSAERFPDKVALVCQKERLTYQEIDKSANRLAQGLKDMGVVRGERVAVFLENSVESVISIFGILKADAVFVIVNSTTKKDKLIYILNNCQVKTLITSSDKWELVKEVLQKTPWVKFVALAGELKSEGKVFDNKKVFNFKELVSSYPDKPPINKNIDIDLASIIYT